MKQKLTATIVFAACLSLAGCNGSDSGSNSNLLTDNDNSSGSGGDNLTDQVFGTVDNDNTGDPSAPDELRGIDPFSDALVVTAQTLLTKSETQDSVTVLDDQFNEVTQSFEVINIAEDEVLAIESDSGPTQFTVQKSSNDSNAALVTVTGRLTIR